MDKNYHQRYPTRTQRTKSLIYPEYQKREHKPLQKSQLKSTHPIVRSCKSVVDAVAVPKSYPHLSTEGPEEKKQKEKKPKQNTIEKKLQLT